MGGGPTLEVRGRRGRMGVQEGGGWGASRGRVGARRG